MARPRQYFNVWKPNNDVIVIDLYATLNKMYEKYRMYKLSPRKWDVLQHFIGELRFNAMVNMARWPQVPCLNGEEVLDGETWLCEYGTRVEIIDLVPMEEEEATDDVDDDDDDVSLLTQPPSFLEFLNN